MRYHWGVSAEDEVYAYEPDEVAEPDVHETFTWRYDEDRVLMEIEEHIRSTYESHYSVDEKSNIQSIDIIHSLGHGEGFFLGNALKYLHRYGKKNGRNRADLLKAIHYVILAMVDEETFRGATG